jgi:hypothetical protein
VEAEGSCEDVKMEAGVLMMNFNFSANYKRLYRVNGCCLFVEEDSPMMRPHPDSGSILKS